MSVEHISTLFCDGCKVAFIPPGLEPLDRPPQPVVEEVLRRLACRAGWRELRLGPAPIPGDYCPSCVATIERGRRVKEART